MLKIGLTCAYVAKCYLNLRATDAQITVLFLYWLPTVQIKQMKELHLKYKLHLKD